MDDSFLDLDRKEVLEDYQQFSQFIHEVILPFEPPGFKVQSRFHHALIWTACYPFSATAAPRGFLKSTIFSRYRPLYRLVQNRPPLTCQAIEYLLISESSSLAISHLDWIKHQLTANPHLIELYGHQRPTSSHIPWSRDEIQLNNGAKAWALGADAQIRGRHPTDILVDDLESHKNMDTPEKLDRLKDWFYRVLLGAMIPETRLTVIGTIIERSSLLTELLGKPEFHGKIWKALQTDGEGKHASLWEERWPVEELLKRRALIGHHKFEAEYQNNPMGSEDAIIWPEWIRRHEDATLQTFTPVRRYMTVDVALTEETWGDYSAITVFDEAPNGMMFERIAWKKKVGAPALRDTIYHFYHTLRQGVPQFILGIEEVATQKFLRQLLTERDPSIMIVPLRPDKDKTRRLIDVSRYFESGTVSFQTESLIEEILSFPHGVKDRVDAVVYALKLYEQYHPLLLGPGQVSELPFADDGNQRQADFDLMRAALYKEHHLERPIPSALWGRYKEAQVIDAMFEDVMD